MPTTNTQDFITDHHLPSAVAHVLPPFLDKLYPATRVIHVGSGQGLGVLHQWREWQVAQALLIDPLTAPWISPALAQHPGWKHCAAVVSETEMSTTWHAASNMAESGVLQAERLQAIWPNLKSLGIEQRQTTTVDKLVAEHFPTWEETAVGNWLLVDCLPALPILQGAMTTLKNCSVAWVRVVNDPALPDLEQAQLGTIQSLLESQQFTLLVVMEGLHPLVGEAIFVRNWPALLMDEIAQMCHQQTLDKTALSKLAENLLANQLQQDLLNQQQNTIITTLDKEKVDHAAARDAEAAAKAEAIAQRDVAVSEKNQLAATRDAIANEMVHLTASRDAEEAAKAQAIAQRDAAVNERNQLAAAHDAIAKEMADMTANREAEVAAKAQAIAQRDAAVNEKNQLVSARDAIVKEMADMTASRDAEVAAKAQAITQRDAAVNEKNQLVSARDAIAKEMADMTASRDAAVNEKSQLAAARDAIAKDKADISASRDAEVAAKAEAIAQRDAAVNEKNQLAAARDAIAKELADITARRDAEVEAKEYSVATQQQEISNLQHRIKEFEADNYENRVRQQLQQDELIKAEAQIELIKDLLLRETGI